MKMAKEIRVKIGFRHDKLDYLAGQIVSDELAKLYPDNVKVVEIEDVQSADEECVEVESEPEPAKKKATKKKAAKK